MRTYRGLRDHSCTLLVLMLFALAEIATLSNPRKVHLQSKFRLETKCFRGNLMTIHVDRACQASGRPCRAKCDGERKTANNTKFSVRKINGKRCIEFTVDQSTKYALKVTKRTNDVVFEKRECNNSIGSEFLFDEVRVEGTTRLYRYKHSDTTCVGVSSDCQDTRLYLHNTTINDKRCYFRKWV